jgi:hypothetical protein
MSAETPAATGTFTRRRLQFRAWRGARPFWAGLFVLLSGIPIAYFPYAHLQVGHLTLAMATTAGAGSLIIGVLLVVLGISLWFQKHIKVFAGVAAILLALVSIPVSNLGGFFVGFLLALIGGGLAIAWAPGASAESDDDEQDVAESRPQSDTIDVNDTSRETPGGTGANLFDGFGSSSDLSTSPAAGAKGRHSAR